MLFVQQKKDHWLADECRRQQEDESGSACSCDLPRYLIAAVFNFDPDIG